MPINSLHEGRFHDIILTAKRKGEGRGTWVHCIPFNLIVETQHAASLRPSLVLKVWEIENHRRCVSENSRVTGICHAEPNQLHPTRLKKNSVGSLEECGLFMGLRAIA